MRLCHIESNFEIEISEDKTFVFYLERQNIFAKLVSEIWCQCENGEGGWNLSDGEDILAFSKNIKCVINPLELNLNDAKLLKILYQEMLVEANENCFLDMTSLNSNIVSFLDDLAQRQPYAIEFEDNISILELFKAYKIRFVCDSSTLLESIVEYIKLWHRVSKMSVFVFVNLRTYLSVDELIQLYQMCRYEHVYLILFESRFIEKLDGECVKIIDNDMCVIDC